MPKKTDPETRARIVQLREEGKTYRQIERELGTSQHVIADTLHEAGLTDKRCDDPHCAACNEKVLEEAREDAYELGWTAGYQAALGPETEGVPPDEEGGNPHAGLGLKCGQCGKLSRIREDDDMVVPCPYCGHKVNLRQAQLA